MTLRSALSFFLFGTRVPVSGGREHEQRLHQVLLVDSLDRLPLTVVPSSLITVSLTVRLTKASTAVDAVRLVPLGECHRLRRRA